MPRRSPAPAGPLFAGALERRPLPGGRSLRPPGSARSARTRLRPPRLRRVREPPGAYHGSVLTDLTVALARFVREQDSGVLLTGDPGFVLQERPLLLRGPDLAFIRKERIPPDGVPDTFWRGAPDLAVEVFSPSDTLCALLGRAREYLEAGAQASGWWTPGARRCTWSAPAGC
nr:Uma2 family endonuclease [Limnochorda pilosa]